MLPPPPLPPMARPVAIIRSTSDLSIINSPPPSITPPSINNLHSPHQSDHTAITESTHDIQNSSPPMSPHDSHQQHRKSTSSLAVSQQPIARLASSYATTSVATGREYSFNPFHSSTGQVNQNKMETNECISIISFQQLFSYSSSLSNMSGVISPTNLSLYSTPITSAPRTTARTRWNTSFILEEDFNMITQHPSAMPNPNTDSSSIILMEEG